jgi:hypothetical protein
MVSSPSSNYRVKEMEEREGRERRARHIMRGKPL